jgi:hypothetical protein
MQAARLQDGSADVSETREERFKQNSEVGHGSSIAPKAVKRTVPQ